jgi:Family of unknown function (DUF5677)
MREWGIYRLRIDAAQDLLDEGARMVDETGRTNLAQVRLLLAAQATRCVHIFESVIALCRIGRGVPASMLDRSLFEEALDAYWIAGNPEEAPARADEHERAVGLGERMVAQRFDHSSTPMSEEEEAEVKQVMSRYKGFQRSWTLATTQERLDLVKASWGDEAVDKLDYVYEVMQRQSSVLLHPSPLGYGLAMGPGRKQINRIGPDELWRDALGRGCLGFYLVLRVIAQEWGFERTTAERLFVYASCVMLRLSDDELGTVRDGGQCPCGSGRAVEDCHGLGPTEGRGGAAEHAPGGGPAARPG